MTTPPTPPPTVHSAVSVADLKDIQAGPLGNCPVKYAHFIFFEITDVKNFRILLRHILSDITTADDARRLQDQVAEAKTRSEMVTFASLNVAFTKTGLVKLLGAVDTGDEAFTEGQFQRAASLGDDLGEWIPQFAADSIDGLFKISGYPNAHLENYVLEKLRNHHHYTHHDNGFKVIFEQTAHTRPGKESGHEHFGFLDGISQPFCKMEDDAQQKRFALPGQETVQPGVLVCGQPGDTVTRPTSIRNGSFLVYRQLQQSVLEFNAFLKEVVLSNIILPGSTISEEEINDKIEYLGARIVGRWKSGTPVVDTPSINGMTPVDDPAIGADPQRNNNFDFGAASQVPRQDSLCPYAAHIRKTNPRTDLPPAADEVHAIFRIGVPYGREVTHEEKRENKTLHPRGLAFGCYQSTIINGFEFLQTKWANNKAFPPKTVGTPGIDLLIGQTPDQPRAFEGYDTADLTKTLTVNEQFIKSRGGGYFIQLSISTLKEISTATTNA